MSASLHSFGQRGESFAYKAIALPPSRAKLPDALAREAATVCFERNDEIVAEGDVARYCYEVVGGCVRTVRLMEDGRRQVAEFLFPGDLFGCDVLDEYDFTAEAVTPTTLRRVARASLEAQADSDRGFARRLRQIAAGRLREARERQVTLGRRTATERLGRFLLEMSGRLGNDARGLLDLPMSRTDIADHLGLTIETVCRVLAQLRRDGAIGMDRARIAIRDRRALGAAGTGMLH